MLFCWLGRHLARGQVQSGHDAVVTLHDHKAIVGCADHVEVAHLELEIEVKVAFRLRDTALQGYPLVVVLFLLFLLAIAPVVSEEAFQFSTGFFLLRGQLHILDLLAARSFASNFFCLTALSYAHLFYLVVKF